jgi:hypothetical protein
LGKLNCLARTRKGIGAPLGGPEGTFDVKLTPLPFLHDPTADQRQHQAHYRVVDEIQAKAEADNNEKSRTPMTVEAIIAQNPHPKPATTDRGLPADTPTCSPPSFARRQPYKLASPRLTSLLSCRIGRDLMQ